MKKIIAEMAKVQNTDSDSFELITPRDRDGSFEPQVVRKRQTNLHPELEAKILSMFASGMSYKIAYRRTIRYQQQQYLTLQINYYQ